MMVVFHISGFFVHVSAKFVSVDKRARVRSSDNGPVSVLLDDVAVTTPAFSFIPPTPLLPGQLRFGPALPAIRVTTSSRDTAEALIECVQRAVAGEFDQAAQALRDSDVAGIDVVDDTPAAPEMMRQIPLAETNTEFPNVSENGVQPTISDMAEFVAFDVETANANFGSIIQFGLAVVENGHITQTHSWLCRPPAGLEEFAEDNIAVHGITPADVANQPTFEERVGQFMDVVKKLPIVAHNARFDFSALLEGCQAAGIEAPEVEFACTYRWARQAKLGLRNLKLPTVAAAAGFDLDNHHDAAADAVACAHIAQWLMRENNVDSLPALSHSLGLTMGGINAGRLRNVRYESGTQEAGQNGHAQVRRQAKWDAAKAPAAIPRPNPDADPAGLLFGQRVTLTGDFAPFDKGELWDKIADAGADINKGVTKKTTIVVAGPWDSMTSKEKRARELQEQGQSIEIWSKEQLLAALGIEAPPF